MRIQAAGRITSAYRGQCDGMRVQRAGVENAHRQPERHHPMREHGSHWQQPRMRWLTLLPDTVTLAFRNPHQGESELESGLSYRAGRQAVDRRIPRNPSR